MALLNQEVRAQVREELADLPGPVRLMVFTQEVECRYCAEARALAEELGELSDRISVEVYDLVHDKDKAGELGIDKIPAIAVLGERDYGIRFFGIPGGYEFTSLLEAIKLASSGDSGLAPASRKALAGLRRPLHVRVFVTLTCPYCPQAVQLAHRCAVESELITGEMIEASEFPHLAGRYQVFAVPKVVLDEVRSFEGALPEEEFVRRVVEAGR